MNRAATSEHERVVRLKRPFAAQRSILSSPARFRVVFGGRRLGKTEISVEALLVGTAENPGATREVGIYWWVGLSWKSASMKRAWRILRGLCNGWCDIRDVEKEIHLPNGSQIWMRTAENPESLSGEGVRGVVMDEFSMMVEIVWTMQVRPTLADSQGWALFVGVPKGKNWAWRLWMRGWGENADAQYRSFQFQTSANPFIPAGEIEEARTSTPELIFRQEWLAEIVDDSGQVFRNVAECATSLALLEPEPGRSYVAGVDLAKINDFTVVSVWDELAKREVALERYNGVNYSLQKPRIIELCKRFGCNAVVIETNNTGEPIVEDLERELPVIRFTTTSKTKTAVIENLALAFEQKALSILPNETALLEAQAYGMERLPSGMFRYGAPEGLHDDTVMARAFAWSHIAAVGLSGRGWLSLFETEEKARGQQQGKKAEAA